jgi:hypothetical protein
VIAPDGEHSCAACGRRDRIATQALVPLRPSRRSPSPKSARADPCRRLLDCGGGRRAPPSAFDPIGPSGALVQTRDSGRGRCTYPAGTELSLVARS